MKVLIIEDDSIYVEVLEVLLKEMNCELIGHTGDSSEAFRLIRATKPDLILLDIHLRGRWNGIEIATRIQEQKIPISIIFITSLSDDVTFENAKETKPFAYITKPFDRISVKRTITLALDQNRTKILKSSNIWKEKEYDNQENSFFIKAGHRLHKIHIPSIYYIEVNNRYSSIVLEDRLLSVKTSLKELAEKLPSACFFKVNKSCMVNIDRIDNIDVNNNLIIIGDYKISLSRRNKKDLLKVLE